jgi:hypothetical protein
MKLSSILNWTFSDDEDAEVFLWRIKRSSQCQRYLRCYRHRSRV